MRDKLGIASNSGHIPGMNKLHRVLARRISLYAMHCASLFLVIQVCVSCGQLEALLSETERAEIVFPQSAGSSGEEAQSWTVRWSDGESQREAEHSTPSFWIDLTRDSIVSIMAWKRPPGLSEPERYGIPVGAIYPMDAEERGLSSRLLLSECGGLVAGACSSILGSSSVGNRDAREIARGINWRRLAERIALLDEPGLFDTERFVNAALRGRILASDVRERELHDSIVSPGTNAIPAGTVFIPQWAGSNPFEWVGGGEQTVRVPSGLSLHRSGLGTLMVQLSAEGTCRSLYMPRTLRE